MSCPFCPPDNKKSRWYFDGEIFGDEFVVADDAGKPDALILFPRQHRSQSWLKKRGRKVENLIMGVANAEWGRGVEKRLDWLNRQYEHAHLQVLREG